MLNFLKFFVFSFLALFCFVVYAQEEFTEDNPDVVDVFIEDLSEEELEEWYEEIESLSVFPADGGSGITGENVVSCFDYYNFNSVQVSVVPTVESTVPGTPITFLGTVTNENNYPVIDGTVYVKIFKTRESDEKNVNGQFVVGQFVAVREITLPANGEKEIEFSWNVPAWAESGEYQLATFFVSKERYNLLGLSFTDDIVGNTTIFEIISNIEGSVYLDKDSVKLNDQEHFFAAFPTRFSNTEPVNIDFDVVNTTGEDESVEITYNIYSWDAMDPVNNLVDSVKKAVFVEAGETETVSLTMTDTNHPVYLVETVLSYKDTKSILNIRFVRNDISKLRINFPSTATYPLIAGEEATIFSCLHNLADNVEDGRLLLTLFDENENEIHRFEYNGKVDGSMLGVASKFTPKKTLTNFSLKADLYQGENLVDQVTMKYRCADLGACEVKENSFGTFLNYLVSGVVILILLAVSLFFRNKLKNDL